MATYTAPSYLSYIPSVDTSRISALTQEQASPAIRQLRNALSRALLQGQYADNPMVQAALTREALSGYGTGIETALSGARQGALSQYNMEYGAALSGAQAQYGADLSKYTAEYQAELESDYAKEMAALEQQYNLELSEQGQEYAKELAAYQTALSDPTSEAYEAALNTKKAGYRG